MWVYVIALLRLIRSIFWPSPYETVTVDVHSTNPELQGRLKEFEREFDYPLGPGRRFRIVHGRSSSDDYFSFLKAMGNPLFYVVRNKNDHAIECRVYRDGSYTETRQHACPRGEIAGVGCAMLRDLRHVEGRTVRTWYICDVKVREEYQGQHIVTRVLERESWRYLQCRRWYFVAMNPSTEGGAPKAARLLQHSVFGKYVKTAQINIYSIQESVLTRRRGEIEEMCGGRVLFKSMKGKKEFEVFPSGRPECTEEWKVLHIQHGPNGETELSDDVFESPFAGHSHLISAFRGCELDRNLSRMQGVELFGTATLVCMGLDVSVFGDTILTNEI